MSEVSLSESYSCDPLLNGSRGGSAHVVPPVASCLWSGAKARRRARCGGRPSKRRYAFKTRSGPSRLLIQTDPTCHTRVFPETCLAIAESSFSCLRWSICQGFCCPSRVDDLSARPTRSPPRKRQNDVYPQSDDCVRMGHLCRDFQAMLDRGGPGQRVGEALLEHARVLFVWWHWVRDGTWRRSTFQS
jgi:hypothetical protein